MIRKKTEKPYPSQLLANILRKSKTTIPALVIKERNAINPKEMLLNPRPIWTKNKGELAMARISGWAIIPRGMK